MKNLRSLAGNFSKMLNSTTSIPPEIWVEHLPIQVQDVNSLQMYTYVRKYVRDSKFWSKTDVFGTTVEDENHR